ncbi:iron-sulfur cluster biosynthesis family protein [Oceanobacillus saliphilus]|uniref:iron-sulfur cluster biosynthesis family protein n=1 Tax=Oceanobacillus saliphilus TaxID=2925834 RepID=UPI00201E58AC|nr:iron-sulfur cluster biosynthesis family protein [Oceanobacillus saliphilus]
MRLTITPEAEQQLKRLKKEDDKYLLLWYDTKGFGCGVSGMPTVRLVKERKSNHSEVENTTIPTLINSEQAVFFSQEMKLDLIKGMYRLSSNDGILNPFIPEHNLVQSKEI